MSQEIWDGLERRLPAVVERSIASYLSASPHYGGAVPEHLHRQMAHTGREFGRLCARVARERRSARPDELAGFAERAGERGAEGLPVSDLLEAWFTIAETLWQDLCDTAGQATAGQAVLPSAATVIYGCLHQVVRVVVEAHQGEFQAARSEEREAFGAIVGALLAGEPAAERAARFGVRIAESYTVLALRLGPHPTESDGDAVGRRLGGRRKLRRLTAELHRALSDEALPDLTPDGGLVLVPSTPDHAATDLAAARAALPRLQRAADVEVAGGFAHAGNVSAVPAAARQAERLLRLASPGQVATLDDLLFEYQLAQDGEAAPLLVGLIDKLRAEHDLLDTLQTYLAHDLNRRSTAARLHVHPNTVDNRLTRIAAVTGADPRTTRGLLLLGAALAVANATTESNAL